MRLYSRLWGRHPRSKTIHKLGDCQTMVCRRSWCDFNLVRDEYVLFTMSLTRTTLPTILKCKKDVVWSVELPVTMELLTTAAKVMSESELLLPRSMVCIIFTTEPPQLHILTRCFLKKYIEEHCPKGSALLLNHYVFTSHQMFCAHDSSSSWSTWFPEFKTLSWGFSETSVEGMNGEFSHWFGLWTIVLKFRVRCYSRGGRCNHLWTRTRRRRSWRGDTFLPIYPDLSITRCPSS